MAIPHRESLDTCSRHDSTFDSLFRRAPDNRRTRPWTEIWNVLGVGPSTALLVIRWFPGSGRQTSVHSRKRSSLNQSSHGEGETTLKVRLHPYTKLPHWLDLLLSLNPAQ